MRPGAAVKVLRAGFFGLFRRKTAPPAPVEPAVPAAPSQADFLEHYRAQKRPSAAPESEVSRFYRELRAQREQEDALQEENAAVIAEATEAFAREQEVSLARNERRRVLVSNIGLLPERRFASLDEFLHFFRGIDFAEVSLTEENLTRIAGGFVAFATELPSAELATPQFRLFLDSVRGSLSVARSPAALAGLAQMLDLCCAEHPELWVKLDQQVQWHLRAFSPETALAVLQAFANQGEGSPELYRQLEEFFKARLAALPAAQTMELLVCLYSARKGSKPFVLELLSRVGEALRPPAALDSALLARLGTVLEALQMDTELVAGKLALLETIEARLLTERPELDLAAVCALAAAFGFDHGSEPLFAFLRERALAVFNGAELTQFKELCHGFVFSYRSPAAFLEKALAVFPRHAPVLSLAFLARLAKSLHLLGRDALPAYAAAQTHILSAMKARPESLSKEDLVEVALAFLLTRNASREFYRVLETVLRKRLHALQFDHCTLDALIEAYELSGLCTLSFVSKLKAVRGTGPQAF